MSTASAPSANLAAACVESFLYGIFFVLSIVSMYFLVQRHRQKSHTSPASKGMCLATFRQPLVIASVFLFLSNTTHWVLSILRIFEGAYIFDGGTQPTLYYAEMSQPIEVARIALLMFSLVIVDAVMIYRLWVVWAHRRVIMVVPVCTFVGLIVCSIGLTYRFAKALFGSELFDAATDGWIIGNFVFTLCTNIYCTVMIGWQVWRVHSSARKYVGGGESITRGLAIFIESAALYTTWTITFCIVFETQSVSEDTFNSSFPIVAGIAFMLLNVRVGMGLTQQNSPASPSLVPSRMVFSRESLVAAINPPSLLHLADNRGSKLYSQDPPLRRNDEADAAV